jgi:hypothetical protein
LTIDLTEHEVTCPLCEAMSGLTVRASETAVHSVRGNRDDGWSHGEHVTVSWDDAMIECERGLRPVIDRHGPRAMTVYLGNGVDRRSQQHPGGERRAVFGTRSPRRSRGGAIVMEGNEDGP